MAGTARPGRETIRRPPVDETARRVKTAEGIFRGVFNGPGRPPRLDDAAAGGPRAFSLSRWIFIF